MPGYAIETTIPATPDRLWLVLTDAARLANGRFGILSIQGRIGQGEVIRLRSTVDPKRVFRLRVTRLTPTEMVWVGGMPFGLFRGTRRFALTPVPDGTKFSLREDYTGPLAGLMFRAIPDLTDSFKDFAAGLAAVATEGQAL